MRIMALNPQPNGIWNRSSTDGERSSRQTAGVDAHKLALGQSELLNNGREQSRRQRRMRTTLPKIYRSDVIIGCRQRRRKRCSSLAHLRMSRTVLAPDAREVSASILLGAIAGKPVTRRRHEQ